MEKRSIESNLDGLLIAILMCYPEIVTIRYRRSQRRLRFLFALRKAVSEEEFKSFQSKLQASLNVFSDLAGVPSAQPGTRNLSLAGHTYLEIELAINSLRKDALSLVVGLVTEVFGEYLIWDSEEQLSPEERQYQEEIIEYMLEDVKNAGYTKDVIGIRDNGRVAIYDQ